MGVQGLVCSHVLLKLNLNPGQRISKLNRCTCEHVCVRTGMSAHVSSCGGRGRNTDQRIEIDRLQIHNRFPKTNQLV